MKEIPRQVAVILGVTMIIPCGCTHSNREEASPSSKPTTIPSVSSSVVPTKNERETAAFIFQWRETKDTEFTSFTITNPQGIVAVREWMRTRADALRKGAEIGPKLSIRPLNLLWEKDRGDHETEIILLEQYPTKLGVPKTQQGEMVTNLSNEDMRVLRDIFITRGTKSEPKLGY